MVLQKTKILGTGIAHPPKTLTNFDLEKMVDTSDEWITERTGIKERRVANPENNEFPSDLAAAAAKQAMDEAGLKQDDIDCIIFTTSSPDLRMPNSATLLQNKLGLSNKCACVDLLCACSGFVYGLNFAQSTIATGMFKNILLVGSENLSSFVNYKDRTTCILFGDGCGVFVLGPSSESESSEVLSTVLAADGSGRDLILLETGGTYRPITQKVLDNDEQFVTMQGQDTFKIAVRTLADNSKEAVKKAGLTLEDIDWFIPHQANIRIIQATGKRLGIDPSKVICNIDKYGNTSTASIPVAAHEAFQSGKIKRGDTILLAAFGSGLTSGATVLRY